MSHEMHVSSSLTSALIACGLVLSVSSQAAADRPEGTSAGIGVERAFPLLRFERPVFLAGAGDASGRIFVVEQDGVIRWFDGDDPSSSALFLDIRDRVNRRGNEEGLLGLAFHPRFAENGTFFVHYSSSRSDMTSTISRFRVSETDPKRADGGSEEVLFEEKQPYRNHNGGMLAFGPDGYLYISLGDGGAANDPHGNGQNLETVLGAILRIDVDDSEDGLRYAIPDDNPFAYEEEGVRRELWAFGLRNVWRFAFDRDNGDLWAGDVGQNRFEEILLIEEAGNYGWNANEGLERFSNAEISLGEPIEPVAAYGRDLGISVTGGYVYRGKRHPALIGSYFYGDYASGNLWRLVRNDEGGFESQLVRRTGRSISSFGEDDEGELFLTSFDGGIYRIVPTASPEDTFASWPIRLSETGVFASVPEGRLGEHMIPYEINVPFWSDGAAKQRYIGLLEGGVLEYQRHGAWEVPVGALLVKNFEIKDLGRSRTLETRMILRTSQGWKAATYVWDASGNEAQLAVEGRQFELYPGALVRTWHAPSASECVSCHTASSGFVLGLTTAQLNRTVDGANQIEAMARRELVQVPDDFDPQTAPRFPADLADLPTQSAELERHARAWLDVNCAMCHQPRGTGNASIDLRWQTPLAETRMLNEPPSQGDLGLADPRILASGKPGQSLLLHRVETLGDGRMPNVATNIVDADGVRLLRAWIEALGERR